MDHHHTISDERIAEQMTMQNLLNCFVRETGVGQPLWPDMARGEAPSNPPSLLRCLLVHQQLEVLAPVRYWSITGRHLFRFPLYYRAIGHTVRRELDYVTLAALLAKELSLASGDPGHQDELLLRVIDSCRNIGRFVRGRRQEITGPSPLSTRFLDAEQSLIFGHPLHPTPKSRQEIAAWELDRYSPELNGAFALHYFRAHRSIVQDESSLPTTATSLMKSELLRDPAVDDLFRSAYCREDDWSLIPCHPWQAAHLLRQPRVQRLLADTRLQDLGPQGSPYYPTASVRTVYHPDAAFMLKLSLSVKITNSLRVNKRKELARGVEMSRLLNTEVGRTLAERFPAFHIVRDPACLTLTIDGDDESGFELILRDNPFRAGHDTDLSLIAALCQDRLGDGHCRLARLIRVLAQREGRTPAEVSRDWFRRYLDLSLSPILWLYATYGIAVEAHQQNAVLRLHEGYPAAFFYRDNQGYYYRASCHEHLERLLPGISHRSQTVCEDRIADERLRYYFVINNVFGLIHAFGASGLIEEGALMTVFREQLEAIEETIPAAAAFVRELLSDAHLRCKANLLTRFQDLDELVGPLESQSVYVTIDNPLFVERWHDQESTVPTA